MRVKDLRVHLEEAGPAKYGSALRWIEWDGRGFATSCTSYRDLDALFDAGLLSSSDRCKSFILRLLAFFAAFWGVLKALVVEELLLTRCPDEVAPTVDTMDGSVLELRFGYPGNYYL